MQFSQFPDYWSVGDLEPVTAITDTAASLNGDLQATPYGGDDHMLVPHGYYAETFQYREDVYDELGLSVPTSYRDLLANARAIDESALDIDGYGLAGKRAGKSAREFQAYLARMGVSPIGLRWRDPDARTDLEVHWPATEITRLLRFFADIAQYATRPRHLDWPGSFTAYLDGEYAQQFHVNNWVVGVGVQEADRQHSLSPDEVVERTGVAPLPYWEGGGVSRGDAWVWEPAPDGHVLFGNGDNTLGARRWLEWLYGADAQRTASLYTVEPTRFMPAYRDVLDTETYRTADLFQRRPGIYDQCRYIQDTIVGEHHHQTEQAALDDLVAIWVGGQHFYGRMVHEVVTGERSPADAYEWGREQLETHLADARDRFR